MVKKMRLTALIIALILHHAVDSAKILIIIPGFTNGETELLGRFGDLLANSGQDVTLFRPEKNDDPDRQEAAPVKEILYSPAFSQISDAYQHWLFDISRSVYNDSVTDLSAHVLTANYIYGKEKFALELCEKLLSDEKLLTELKNEHFDLAVVNSDDLCALGLVRVLNVPSYVSLTSGALTSFLSWTSGIPSPPSYVPNSLTPFSDRMPLKQRVQNFAASALSPILHRRAVVEPMNEMFRKFQGNQFPDLSKLVEETPIIFVNDEELIGLSRPILHKTVYIGGFNPGGDYSYPVHWENVMKDADAGVVLISIGAMFKTSLVPSAWTTAIINSCATYPAYTFIWKHEGEVTNASEVKNLKVTPSMPQEQLLGT